MRPNFEAMSNKDLIAYILTHRDEIEPLHVLYNRRTPDSQATWYGSMATEDGLPIEENIRIAEAAIKQRIEQGNLQAERTSVANEVTEQALQDFIVQDKHTNQES